MVDSPQNLAADYNDGATAARRAVVLHLTGGGLAIHLAGEDARIAVWPYDRLRRLDEDFPGAPLRLALQDGDARLTLRDQGLPEDLLAVAPQLAGQGRRAGRTAMIWLGSFAGAIAVLSLVILSLPFFARQAVHLVPKSWEAELGSRMIGQVVEFFSFAKDERPGFCVSPAGQAVLGRVSERLAAFSDSPFPFDVRVLDLDMVNAIALPGGPIIIFRGLLEQAQSSDELAGVLAHEMSHVARRHAMERLMEALGLSFIFGVMLGDIGSGVLVASGEVMVNLSFSRRAEAEADDGAIVLLQKNGISTQGLADFFERLQGLPGEEGSLLEIISTHPVSAARARKFADLANDAPPALSAEDWQALRRICETTAD